MYLAHRITLDFIKNIENVYERTVKKNQETFETLKVFYLFFYSPAHATTCSYNIMLYDI